MKTCNRGVREFVSDTKIQKLYFDGKILYKNRVIFVNKKGCFSIMLSTPAGLLESF